MKTENEDLRRLMTVCNSIGSKILGGCAGLVASTAFGVPVAGVVVSPFFAVQLERAGKELIDRQLGPRQKQRVAAAYVMAVQLIHEALANGKKLRQDSFFENDESQRSAAEELTEAMLNTAMLSHEEFKIPFIAELLKSFTIDASIDRSSANTMLLIANELTYRSIVIMHIIQRGNPYSVDNAKNALYLLPNQDMVMLDVMQLYRLELICMKDTKESKTAAAILGSANIEFGKLYLTDSGQFLSKCMNIEIIKIEDNNYRQIAEMCDFAFKELRRQNTLSIDGGTG